MKEVIKNERMMEGAIKDQRMMKEMKDVKVKIIIKDSDKDENNDERAIKDEVMKE